MTTYKAMFGIDAFEAQAELKIGSVNEGPYSLAKKLSILRKILVTNATKSRV